MEKRTLGRTGIECGVIGMGTWRTFDVDPSSQRDVLARTELVAAALSAGGNLFDSSPMYGSAEVVLSRALGHERKKAIVATKVWNPSFDGGRQQITHALQLYDGIVDIYQVHNLVAWRQYLPVLISLKQDGKIRSVGVTHYARSAFSDLRHVMETESIDMIQIPYNAADRSAEAELLPLAVSKGLGVLVMSPLGTGDLLRQPPALKELMPLQKFGVQSWPQALLKWVVSEPGVTAVIPATSSVAHLADNLQAGNPPFFGPEERSRVSWLAEQSLKR